jgi:hypothetical protein
MRKHVNKQPFLGNHAGSIQAAVLIGHSDLASRMRLTENCRFVMVDMKFRWDLGSHRSRFSVVFITSIAGKTRPHEMPI